MGSALLLSRRFFPLFAAQLLGALNDNLFKNALVVLIVFRGTGNALLVPLAGGIFILPYALFSALAGQLADRTDKARLIRITKIFELGLMLAAAAAFSLGSEPLLLAILFGLGVQATFFGPLKYGILPELLTADELLGGNALIEASTFIGILIGTVAGGLLVLVPGGPLLAGLAACAVAAAGVAAAWWVPLGRAAASGLPLGGNPVRATIRLIGAARRHRGLWQCILGLSWFWALGAAFLAEFPVLVRSSFGGDGQIVTLLLAVFSVGVGAGSLLANTLLGGRISARPVAPAAAVLSLFALDFAWRCHIATPATGWRTPAALLDTLGGWHLLIDLFAVAAAGGVYSVPLYALLQQLALPDRRARMIAANNIMNAVFLVACALALAAGTAAGIAPATLLAGFALANLAVAAVIAKLDPSAQARHT